MESLACRSAAACRVCPHSDRAGACLLEAQVDLALVTFEPAPRVAVAAWAARRASA